MRVEVKGEEEEEEEEDDDEENSENKLFLFNPFPKHIIG